MIVGPLGPPAIELRVWQRPPECRRERRLRQYAWSWTTRKAFLSSWPGPGRNRLWGDWLRRIGTPPPARGEIGGATTAGGRPPVSRQPGFPHNAGRTFDSDHSPHRT